MPLIKSASKKAVGENIKKEMAEGKPQKQAIAIALGAKRAAAKKKMARGGEIKAASIRPDAAELDARDEHMSGIDAAHDELEMRMMAEGGEMPAADDMDEMEMRMMKKHRIVDAVMRKRKMAEGGEVADLQDNNGDEHLNEEDQLSYEAARKKTYFDDDQMSAEPEDSNLHGHDLPDEDEHDMVSVIRNKMRMKR